MPAIVGMGKAIEMATENIERYNKKLIELRNYTIDEVLKQIPDSSVNGDLVSRLPGNVSISIKGVEAEPLLLMLDMNGICASSGSACTSGTLNPSHVLRAIGLNDTLAKGTLRISYGEENTMEDAKKIVSVLKEVVHKLRNMK